MKFLEEVCCISRMLPEDSLSYNFYQIVWLWLEEGSQKDTNFTLLFPSSH